MRNRCVLRSRLKVLTLEIADFMQQSIPQFWRGYLNDLLPKVALVRKDGSPSRRPLEDDFNLFAPGNLTEISSCD